MTNLSPTLTAPSTGTVGTAITLTGGSTDTGKIGTLTKTYQYYNGSSWVDLSSGSYTASSEGTVKFRYKVSDNGVKTSGTSVNGRTARVEYSSEQSVVFSNPTTPDITAISSSSSSLKIGETATITTTLANTVNPTVTYSSSDSTVLSVTKVNNTSATIKALKPGSATITASLSDSGTTDTATTSSISVATPTIGTYSYSTSSMLIGTSSSTPSYSLTSGTYNSSSTVTWKFYLASTGTTTSNNYVTINADTGVMTAKSTYEAVTSSNQNVYAVATVTYNGVSYTTARRSTTYNVFAYYLMGLGGGWSKSSASMFTYDSSRTVWTNSRALTAKTYSGNTDGFKVVKVVNSTFTYYDYTSAITMTRSGNDDKTTALDSTSTGNFAITADVAGTYVFDLALTNNTTPSTIKPHYPQKITYSKNGKTTTAFPTTTAYVTYNTAIGSAPATTPAATGYTFKGWYTGASNNTSFDFANTKITSATTIYAQWTTHNNTVTYSSGDGYTITGTKPATADYDSTVSFDVTVLDGYRLDSVKYTPAGGSATNATHGTGNEYHFTMPDANVAVTVTVVKTYTVTLNTSASGFATKKYKIGSGSQQTYNSAFTVDTGSIVVFDVTYTAGYQFSSASSNVTASNSNTTFTTGAITADTTVTLSAVQITYPVQIAAFAMDSPTAGYVPFSTPGTEQPTVSGTPAVTYSSTSIAYSTTARTVTKGTAPAGYTFVGWYKTTNVSSAVTSIAADYNYSSNTGNTTTFTPNGTAGSTYYRVIALYKKNYYITTYTSWVDTGDDYEFVAAPPRKVTVGEGTSVRATYTYSSGTVEQRGEDNTSLNNGTPSVYHNVTATGTYYEGNRLLVLAGETITLYFTSLASSDAIRGVYYNNDRRYTVEGETDNLYKSRVYKAGGWGNEGDDEWKYDYATTTTLFADASYYDGAAASTITANQSGYVAQNGVNQINHTVAWVASQDYLNIDIELGTKYKLYINNEETDGLTIINNNEEGYYYGGETMQNNFKVSLDNSADPTCTFSWTSITATVKDEDGVDVAGITVSPKQSGGSAATSTSNLSYFLISGNMPNKDVYITIPFAKTYLMRMANIVVADAAAHRTMITEGNSNTDTTNYVGNITAQVKNGNTVVTANIATDGNNYYTWNAQDGNESNTHNRPDYVGIYTSSTNNKKLNGGVNIVGSNVADGNTVTYTFTPTASFGVNYSFVGWFEGTYTKDSDTDYHFTVDYNKKLSGNTTFTYTPTKNTVVIAAATRDIYIGGNFSSTGGYTSTSSSQTWTTGRPKMGFDPTYVKDGVVKGRYFYEFENVTANTEYQFRCYDTVSSNNATSNLTVWQTWSGSDYADDNNDIFYGRHKYDAQYGYSHGAFVYKTNTNNWSLIDNTASDRDSTKNHQANGYGAPVTVYFYAYDGGITVNSTYQWSMAYVSEGRGIDVKSVTTNGNTTTTTYNVPVASVANKTVNNKDVTVTTQTNKYGSRTNNEDHYEKIYECQVKEKDGQIVITANPKDRNVELQAFLVYNIETKASEAVLGPFTTSGDGDNKAYTGNVTIPQNSKIYVVPIYKFTDDYISSEHLGNHKVYVRTSDIDKDVWGGLVAMYSWGTASGYDSGGWPGQLLIPSDDGTSFYGYLTYTVDGLAGITINNYSTVWGGTYNNFIGSYKAKGVSDVTYSANDSHIYQSYDYREPISIVDNIADNVYGNEDMDLTFALKPGNKTGATAPAGTGDGSANTTEGNSAWNANYAFEYLTDRSGKNRVDLNGNKLKTNATATYYIICKNTDDYSTAGGSSKTYNFVDGDRENGTSTRNQYSIDWYVYNAQGTAVLDGGVLSAGFTDVYKSEMVTYISDQLLKADYPVSGKAVKIAYELPGTWNEAVRYSGQWYADGVNNMIEANAIVGVYSDGVFTPSETNNPGYAKASINLNKIEPKADGEAVASGDGTATVTKTHASNGLVTFRVSTTENFQGWYREVGDGEFEKIGSNYMNQEITPAFNDDITYYAFYSASASYVFKYESRRNGTKQFTAKGTDLTPAELGNGGILDLSERSADIATKLSKITDITVFGHTLNYALTSADDSKPYTITFTAGDTAKTYNLNVYAYNTSGDLALLGTASGGYATSIDVTTLKDSKNAPTTWGAAGQPVTINHTGTFLGWYEYDPDNGTYGSTRLSSRPNYGFGLTNESLTIAPKYGTASDLSTLNTNEWSANVDHNEITIELDNADSGKLLNDSLIRFTYSSDSAKKISVDGYDDFGIIVMAQGAGATSTQQSNFRALKTTAGGNGYANKVQTYCNHVVTNGSAKLNSTNFGTAYALIVRPYLNEQHDELTISDLNRVNLCQILDYATFSGGDYMVMAYMKNSSGYVFSDVISGTYTKGVHYPTV